MLVAVIADKFQTRTQPDNPKSTHSLSSPVGGLRLATPQDPGAARLTLDGRRPDGEAKKRSRDGAPLALTVSPFLDWAATSCSARRPSPVAVDDAPTHQLRWLVGRGRPSVGRRPHPLRCPLPAPLLDALLLDVPIWLLCFPTASSHHASPPQGVKV